jgi:aspartate/methionine/tyrosine aminotransferase
VTREDAFQLFPTLIDLLPPDGINLSRGDPSDPPSPRSCDAVAALMTLAARGIRAAGHDSPRLLTDAEALAVWELFEREGQLLGRSDVVADVRCCLSEVATGSGLDLADLLRLVFAEVSGLGYGDPIGQPHIRAVVARELLAGRANLGRGAPAIHGNEIILTSGANHALGIIFRALRRLGHLKPGDCVGMIEPVYSPYVKIAGDELGLDVRTIPTNSSNSWQPTVEQVRQFRSSVEAEGVTLRLVVIVNPSNPTGGAVSPEVLDEIASLARATGAIVIEDIVYHEFLPMSAFASLWAVLPEQTLLVHSMSKFMRATGTRLGVMVVSDAFDDTMTTRLASAESFRDALAHNKGPGPGGSLSHTDHVPTPMQWQMAVRLLIDRHDGLDVALRLKRRWLTFYDTLGVANPMVENGAIPFVPYYAMVDLIRVISERAQHSTDYAALSAAIERGVFSPWNDFFVPLAEAGVAVLPGARFFADPAVNQWTFRVSVANASLDAVAMGAEMIDVRLRELAALAAHVQTMAPAAA